MSRRLMVLASASALMLAAPDAAEAQCAMCRQALSSPEAAALVAALRRGIVLLILAPALAFGTVAYLAVRGQRRALGSDRPEPGARGHRGP